jgi:hypothetical protein
LSKLCRQGLLNSELLKYWSLATHSLVIQGIILLCCKQLNWCSFVSRLKLLRSSSCYSETLPEFVGCRDDDIRQLQFALDLLYVEGVLYCGSIPMPKTASHKTGSGIQPVNLPSSLCPMPLESYNSRCLFLLAYSNKLLPVLLSLLHSDIF